MNADESIVTSDSVVIQHQEEVSIYPNRAGGVTIQSVDPEFGKTVHISFQIEHAERVIAAIRLAVSEADDMAVVSRDISSE